MGLPAKRRSWDSPGKSTLPHGTLADAVTTVALVDPSYAVRRAIQERREGAPVLYANSTMVTKRVLVDEVAAKREQGARRFDALSDAPVLCNEDTTRMVAVPVELLQKRAPEVAAPEPSFRLVRAEQREEREHAPAAHSQSRRVMSDPTPVIRAAAAPGVRVSRMAVMGIAMFCAANLLLACVVLFK